MFEGIDTNAPLEPGNPAALEDDAPALPERDVVYDYMGVLLGSTLAGLIVAAVL